MKRKNAFSQSNGPLLMNHWICKGIQGNKLPVHSRDLVVMGDEKGTGFPGFLAEWFCFPTNQFLVVTMLYMDSGGNDV